MFSLAHLSTGPFSSKWVFSLGLVASLGLTGCNNAQSNQADGDKKTTEAQPTTTISIGYQKYGVLTLLKARGTLENELKADRVQVRWVEFPAGPQLLEGLNVGSINFGEVGEAPPIFAQAANPDIRYFANQNPGPKGEALIVRADSEIRQFSDLKGKRIALNKGSNVHYLLLKLLEKNNLSLNDIQAVYLPPADARAAFEKGAVDAWVIWDPFLAAAQEQLETRVLADGEGVVNNRQFYITERKFAQQHPQVLAKLKVKLDETSLWAEANPDAAASILEKPTGLSKTILKASILRKGSGVSLVTPSIVQDQQVIADAFYQQKLIPQAIQVQDAVIR